LGRKWFRKGCAPLHRGALRASLWDLSLIPLRNLKGIPVQAAKSADLAVHNSAAFEPLDLSKLLKNPVFRKYFTEGLALEQFPVGKIFFVYFFLRLHQDGLFNFIGNHNDTVEISKDQVAGFY
jgi:hypothetical protein